MKMRCLVDGCEWEMEGDQELREDGESKIDLHLNSHKVDELQNAARNGMLFAFCDDPLQTETAEIYIKAFLEWVRLENTNHNYADGEAKVFIPNGDINEPSNEEISKVIDQFINSAFQFGN